MQRFYGNKVSHSGMKHRASGWILHADWSQNEFGNPLVCRNLFSYLLPTSLWYSSRMVGRNSLTVVCNLLRVPSISGSFPSKNKMWFLLVECGLGPSSLTEFWVFLCRCKQMLKLRCVEKSGSEKTVNLGTMWKNVALVCFKVLSRPEVLNLFMLEITIIQCNLPEDRLFNCCWNPL
jgi:hypothetical protein